MARALHDEYRTADLGNLGDPIDELVYISLTRQTHHWNALPSWRRVEKRGGPEALVGLPIPELEELFQPAGFSRQKARWIKDSLVAIVERFGELSLDAVDTWPDAKLEAFLASLSGISTKSAKCIMLYSLGRRVLPVDTHVRRLATRLGWVPEGLSEKRIHEALEAMVRPADRMSIHVNAIWHGRSVCTALRPKCADCLLQSVCPTGAAAT